jgi:Protein of unknown function (DUF3667)
MENCKSCNQPLTGNFCSNCGRSVNLKRIDKHYVLHEVSHLLHLEKGFFYTVKELFLRPGKSICTFIAEDRNKLMKPIAFLVFASVVFTVFEYAFKADKIYQQRENLQFDKSSITTILNWVKGHWGYTNIMVSIFIGWSLRLFFKKYKYNLFESIVLICFVTGQTMLILTFFTPLVSILSVGTFILMTSLISYGYAIWAIAQFYDGRKIVNYIKAIVAYFLGYILFYLLIVPVGLIADLVIKFFSGN